MPHNEEVEERIIKIVSRWKNTEKKRMFGGVCHLLNGNMFCGVYKDFLILRLGEKSFKERLELPYVRPFDITGKPMKGWVMVEEKGFKGDHELKAWLNQAKDFVKTLPSKK
ncbi:MAG: TfoX/Sxy family protein [Pseudomonadota bacterium]